MGSCNMPGNYPQVGYMDSSGMGSAAGRGQLPNPDLQGCDWPRQEQGWASCSSQPQPCMQRGHPALGGLSRVGDAALLPLGPCRGWQEGKTPRSTGAAQGFAAGRGLKTL